VLPASGGVIVLQDKKHVTAEHPVLWEFHCYREGVVRIGIKFKDEDAKFFNDGGHWKTEFKIDFPSRKFMWATPQRQIGDEKKRDYSIAAWNSSNTPLEELDPRIIIDDPD
jgi:hypothetical protein